MIIKGFIALVERFANAAVNWSHLYVNLYILADFDLWFVHHPYLSFILTRKYALLADSVHQYIIFWSTAIQEYVSPSLFILETNS